MADPTTDRTCRRGLHTIPAGMKGCRTCKGTQQRAHRAANPAKRPVPVNLPSYLRGTFPPPEILAGAACSPETAALFDPAADGETRTQTARRQAKGAALCRGCPVRAECLRDAYDNRRMGVYGGVVMNQGYWSSEGRARAQGVVQVVPVVQDSTAC